jgi:hypothetical protein
MVLVDAVLAWLRRVVGYVPTPWSLLRVAVFTAAALLLAAVVVPDRPGTTKTAPYNRRLASDTTRNVALPLNDPRGFKPTPHGKTFRVAWVGGSELLGVKPKERAFIPRLVTDQIGSVDGRPASTDIYFLNAIRLADQLAAQTSAVSSEPDMVVVSLNPVWVLNDLAVQQWTYLDGVLAHGSLWPPSRWPVAASLVSPGDLGWQTLAGLSRPIEDRYDWGVEESEKTESFTFLDSVLDTAPPPLTGLGALGQRRPVDFFFSDYIEGKRESRNQDLRDTQLQILQREVDSKSALNRSVLQQMFEVARRSGIPTYFYVPPIDPKAYATPDGKKYLDEVRRMLVSATEGETSAKVSFDPQGLQDRVRPVEYQDIVHVLQPKPEARVLAKDLCELLRKQGRDPECEGR